MYSLVEAVIKTKELNAIRKVSVNHNFHRMVIKPDTRNLGDFNAGCETSFYI